MFIKSFFLNTRARFKQRPLFAQILFVFMAFGFMVFSSYIFTSNIVRKELVHDAEGALAFTQKNITAEMQEPVIMMNIIAPVIRDMILNGDGFDTLADYLSKITGYILTGEQVSMANLIGVFGIFDVFDGLIYKSSGMGSYTENLWYRTAVEAGGGTVYTEPYIDPVTSEVIVSYLHSIFDENNRRLGIIGISLKFDCIMDYAVNPSFIEGGYGVLVNKSMDIIAHPVHEYLWLSLRDFQQSIASLADELEDVSKITERKFINYSGDVSIAFFRPMENNWYLGVVTPVDKYYKYVTNMAWFLSSLGTMLAVVLSAILIRINAKRQRLDERIKALLDSVPMCANFWNKNFQNVFTNQESVRVFELSSKEEYLKRFFDLSPEYQPDGRLSNEKVIEYVNQAFKEGYSRFEWIHQKLSGEPIPCDTTLVRIEYQGGHAVTGWTRDLREHEALLFETHRAQIAEESNKAKNNFLAKISHEIRTPLNVILGITEIQLQNQDLPPDTQDALGKMYDSGYMLLNIINDILDLSKIEAGILELSPVKYDVPSLINDTLYLNIMLYSSAMVKFNIDVDENIPSMLLGDVLRIKQILNNLLSNAFKYTKEGEVSLLVAAEYDQCAERKAEADQEAAQRVTLVIKVSDTGKGMSQEQVKRLFDEYTRFNTEANRTTAGAGLGMSITRHLVEMMNGEITVESELGKGSVFTVRLPQEKAGGSVLGRELTETLKLLRFDKMPHMKKSPQILREYMPYGRILIVDDVETNLYVARGLMAPYGLSLETATSGPEAIAKIKKGATYDIIFMDHFMPEMDGIETAHIIRSLGYNYPIVALTADAVAGQAQMFIDKGFDGFISKPVDIRQLNITLNRLIRDKYPPEVVKAAQRLKNDQVKDGGDYAPKLLVHRQLLEIFVSDAEKAVAVLERITKNNYRRNEDAKMFVVTVHALKSALAHIGEEELSGAAFELEKAGREEKLNVMIEETPAFLESLRPVIEKIKKIISSETRVIPGVMPDNSLHYLCEKLTVIKKACMEYDTRTADDALAELKTKPWPKQTLELLDAIARYLLHSDFENAEKTAENFLENPETQPLNG